MENCKTCDRVIEKEGYHPTCQFISNFIEDTYYAPNGIFFVEENDFCCNQWIEKYQKIKHYKTTFNKLIKDMKISDLMVDSVVMTCNEDKYPRIIRAIGDIKGVFEKYLISNFHKKEKGIRIWRKEQ